MQMGQAVCSLSVVVDILRTDLCNLDKFFVERNLFVRQHCGHFPYSFLHILGIFRDYLQHCVGRRLCQTACGAINNY